MPELASVNGVVTPSSEAVISAWDRGFIFGDGVYDVIHIYHKKPFQLSEHLERFYNSAAEIDLARHMPPKDKLEKECLELAAKSGIEEGQIYLQATRGPAKRKSSFPEKVKPTIFIAVEEFRGLSLEQRERGVSVITVPDYRWNKNNIKSVNLLPKVLNHELASRAGAYDAIYVDREGFISEATGCNIFFVEGERLVTTPLSPQILPGVTRVDILRLAQKEGIPILEEETPLERLLKADEVFLSGTLTEVLGVVKVDDNIISGGKVGPITKKLYSAYCELVSRSLK